MYKRILFISLIVVILDQLSKFFAVKYLNYSVNDGALFGMFNGGRIIFIIVAVIIIFLILKFKKDLKTDFGVGLVIGGTFGNLIDRIFRGVVIDFIDLKIWPSFNIADLSVSIGVIIIIWYLVKKEVLKI